MENLATPVTNSVTPTLRRLRRWMDADEALLLMTNGRVRAGGYTLAPSGADALACMLARALLGHCDAAALAVPRGETLLPAVVGAYVAIQRHRHPHLHGSVLVASARGGLAAELAGLTVDGPHGDAMRSLRVGRLVSRPKPGTGGVLLDGSIRPPDRQAMLRPLDRSAAVGLSERDGHVLFARPSFIPAPPAKGVISYAIVETSGSARPQPGHADELDSADAWSSAHRTLLCAGARTLWLGELGDELFEAFCAARAIPLVHAGWPLLAELAQLPAFQHVGAVSSSALTRRATNLPPPACRIVHDHEREELVNDCYLLLGKMRRQARAGPLPAPVKSAYELMSLTTRLAVTLEDYEYAAAVGSPMFNRSVRALITDIRRADAAQFHGRWKEAYRRHWDALSGALRALARLAEDEPAKLHAAFEELAAAQRDGRELVICTQTETERRALIKALAELEVSDITVATFARRAQAGGAGARRRVLLLGAPPPWQAPLLLSGEKGDTVVLCYEHEEARLRNAVCAAHRTYCDDARNAPALDDLGFPAASANGWHPPAAMALVTLAPFGEPRSEPDAPSSEREDANKTVDAWQELVGLWGTDIEPGPPSDEHASESYAGTARIVHFAGAPPVALREDRTVDVIGDADAELDSKSPGELVPGEHIAFLPGVEHHSLCAVLMAAWDETRQTERALCEPLWRAAIKQAVERHGLHGLHELCNRHESTIRSWLYGPASPGHHEPFAAVLRASGNEAVWEARAPVWEFINKTRDTHRLIGRRLRAAIGEALADQAEQPNVRALEELTGVPVSDLLDVVEELVVTHVSSSVAVSLADCGHPLRRDHPLLQGAST